MIVHSIGRIGWASTTCDRSMVVDGWYWQSLFGYVALRRKAAAGMTTRRPTEADIDKIKYAINSGMASIEEYKTGEMLEEGMDEDAHTVLIDSLEDMLHDAWCVTTMVVFALSTMLENCADMTSERLEFSPELEQAMLIKSLILPIVLASAFGGSLLMLLIIYLVSLWL